MSTTSSLAIDNHHTHNNNINDNDNDNTNNHSHSRKHHSHSNSLQNKSKRRRIMAPLSSSEGGKSQHYETDVSTCYSDEMSMASITNNTDSSTSNVNKTNSNNNDIDNHHDIPNQSQLMTTSIFSQSGMSASTSSSNCTHTMTNAIARIASPSRRDSGYSISLLSSTFSMDDMNVEMHIHSPLSKSSQQNSNNSNEDNDLISKPSTKQQQCNTADFYPRLTLTMSDKPMNTNTSKGATSTMQDQTIATICRTEQRRSRADSVPPSITRTNIPPIASTERATSATLSTTTTTTAPHRKQINLSLSIPPKSPIPLVNVPSSAKTILSLKSKQAKIAFQQQNLKLQQRIRTFHEQRIKKREERLKKRREQKEKRLLQRQQQKKQRNYTLIPSNHSLKLLWDALTILLTFFSAINLHTYIRDRSTYDYDAFSVFSNIWFGIDLLLNFITDHRTSDGTVIRTGREVAGRYLTTWFAVDALSMLPWERMFIRPIILMQNRRNIVTKWFFRSKGVVKVTRYLGKRKFLIKYFKQVSKETKKVGVGANRLIRLLVKYIPKYLLFYRNMKGVLLLKTLRLVHYLRKLYRGLTARFDHKEEVEETRIESDHEGEEEEDLDVDDDDVASVESMDLDFIITHSNQDLDLKFNYSLDDNRMSSLKTVHMRSLDEVHCFEASDSSLSSSSSRMKRRPYSTRALRL